MTPPVGDGVGYGVAAVETIKAIQRKEIRVSYNTHEPLVHISFVQPDFYSGHPDQYRVGYTPWESSLIPERWVESMNQMQEIWTTATYCKDVFENQGVKNVTVVPHGIDPEVWKIESRFEKEHFLFLHVGGPTDRKGGQKTVDAFLDLFDGKENVHLLMKSNGPSETRYYDKQGQFRTGGSHPQIDIIEGYMETWQLAELYRLSSCLVYPTNGEGFGFIPFQGIASGIPTICTNASGCADFAELSVPLSAHPAKGVGVHLGDWFEPDTDDLRDKMLYVYNNYNEVTNKTVNSAKVIHATQTWDCIATQITEILGDKISKRA